MSNSETGGNESGGEECPTCGETFVSELGVQQHHSRAHNERLGLVEKTCEICGDTYEVKESHADNRRTCSRDCAGKRQSQEWVGEDNPNWQGGGVDLECEVCGELFTAPDAVADSRRTCGKPCQAELRRQDWTGEGNPNYKEPVTKECVVCGEEYTTTPYMSDLLKTCGSDECYRENMREVNSGTTHPCWNGGYSEYYGPNWDEQREKALARDSHTCQSCGATKQDVKQDLHAHHLKRKEWFVENRGEEWWIEANSLENLVTLCNSCHQKWEGIPIRPKLIEND